jgi:hypothetical protein
MKQGKVKPKSAPKRVLRLPDLDHTKLSVLNTLGSPQSQRAYDIAINDSSLGTARSHASHSTRQSCFDIAFSWKRSI